MFRGVSFLASATRVSSGGAIVTHLTVITSSFAGGAGETIRRERLKQADVHTLLRLPSGIFYSRKASERFESFAYEELAERDKVDLETALDNFGAIAEDMKQ
jgi:hypothetical protein